MIQIKAPDGSLVQFPDGTDDATITKVMGENFPPPKPTTGRPASLTDVAASAMTFGLTNDMAGVSSAVGPTARAVGQFLGIPGVEYKSGEIGDAYSTGRNNAVRKLDAYREQNPWTAFAGDMAGGIANPVAKAGIAAPGASMLQKALLGGATGAGMGAGYGFGNTEGDLGDRGMGAVTGGLVGGAVGAAAAPVVEGVGRGVKYLSDQTIGRMGATNQASVAGRKVAEALQRDGITPTQAAQLLTDIGPDAVLADLGKNSQALAGSVTRAPGKGGADLTAMLTARQEGARDAFNALRGSQSQRIKGEVDGLIPGSYTAKDRAALATARTNQSRGLYNASSNDAANLIPDDKFTAIKGDEYLSGVIAKVKADKLAGMGDLPDNALPVIDAAKRELGDLISAAKRAGRNNEARLLTLKQDALVDVADKAFPQYAQAREVWQQFSGVMDAGDLGRKFMIGQAAKPDDLAAAVAKMGPEELNQIRIGAAQAIKDRLGELNTRSDATKRLMDIPALEERTRAVFGDQQTFKRYIDMLKGERTMFNTYGEVTGNSKTAARLAADADLNADPGGMAQAVTDIARDPANPMKYLAAAGRFAGDAKARMATPEPVRNQIANMMMMNDPLSAPQLARSMQQVQMSEANRRALARALLGTGSSAGGYFNR